MKSYDRDILLVFHRPFAFRDAATIREHIRSFSRFSRFGVRSVNTEFGFPSDLRTREFPALVLHYSLFAGAHYVLSDTWLDFIDNCRSSYKIAFFQDEYSRCQQRFAFTREHSIDCVFTLLEEEWIPSVYGRYANVESVVPTLAGYVSEELVRAAGRFSSVDERRTVDIGYRARELLPYMGKAAKEKTFIADEVRRRCAGTDLALDIETEEHRRIYGTAWHRFLGRCRALLGVEAGVSVFDLEGVVYSRYAELLEENPRASFDEMIDLLQPAMDPWEDRIYYRTISPRHFEAAAFGICQILFEGRYSGILEPMRHYIPLEKDFSNFDEVIRLFRSGSFRRETNQRAYDDLVASGTYSYRRFVADFDRLLIRQGLSPRRTPGILQGEFRACTVKANALPRLTRHLGRAALRRLYTWTLRVPFARPVLRALLGWYRARRRRTFRPS